MSTPTTKPPGLTITVDDGELAPAVIHLDQATAWDLAQFLKRAHFGTCERLSDPTVKEQPQRMMNGLCALQRAFSEAGYAPR